jgi:hypothetical protein
MATPARDGKSPLAAGVFADKILTCKDCGDPFAFTAGEQRFFQSKNFTNDPVRCLDCRRKRRDGGKRFRREEHR